MVWIRRYKQKSIFPKFQLIPILRFQVMHDYVCFIAPIDYCVIKYVWHSKIKNFQKCIKLYVKLKLMTRLRQRWKPHNDLVLSLKRYYPLKLSSFWPSMPIFSMLSVDLNKHQFYNEIYHQRYEIKAYDNRNTMVKKSRKLIAKYIDSQWFVDSTQ